MSRTTVCPARARSIISSWILSCGTLCSPFDLADRDQLDLAAGMLEHAGAGEAVVENDVGGFQRAHRFQR